MFEMSIQVTARQEDVLARARLLDDADNAAAALEAGLQARSSTHRVAPRPLLPGGLDVPPGCIAIGRLARGDRLKIAQTGGRTCVDVVAWGEGDRAERLSAAHSRPWCGANPSTGALLVSAPPWERPLFSIVEDTAPGHDLLFPACSPGEFASIGSAPLPNCQALHRQAADACGAPNLAIPEPLNLWFRSWTASDGTLEWTPTPTAPGDAVTLEAVSACRIGVNPCVSDLFGCSPYGASAIRLFAESNATIELLGEPLPPPSITIRVSVEEEHATTLARRAERLGTTASALARALLLERAVTVLGQAQTGGR